jgi:predicted ester cyclase
VKGWLREFVTAFPDTRITIDYAFADTQRVVCRTMIRGTFTGAYRGVEPTGRRLVLPSAFLFRVVNGRITDIEAFYDTRHLQEQLGTSLPAMKRFAEE